MPQRKRGEDMGESRTYEAMLLDYSLRLMDEKLSTKDPEMINAIANVLEAIITLYSLRQSMGEQSK